MKQILNKIKIFFLKILYINDKKKRLKKMFEIYHDNLEIYNSEGTLNFVKQHAKSLLSYFTDVYYFSIQKEQVLNYISFCQKMGLSNNTINKRLSLLKRLYKYHDFKCDFINVKKLPEEFVTYGYLDPAEIATVEKLKLSLRDKVMISLFIDTGVRLNELRQFKMKNIDYEKRNILLEKTKTKKRRYVFFTSITKKYLMQFCQNCNRDYLFINDKTSEPLTRYGIESIFKRINKKHQIKKMSSHMLRHSLSTNLYHPGADVIFIGELLGHSSPETTKRYIHSNTNQSLKIYDKYQK